MGNLTFDRNPQRRASAQLERPTIHSANLLFLVSAIVMMVTLVMPTPGWSPHLVSIIPMALFLLLAWLFTRFHNLPVRTTLRVRWPGFRVAALSFVIGTGIWMVAGWLGHLVELLFGYSVPWSPDFFPTTPAQVAALFLSWCVAAPLGEEVLFRGIIQRAHERRGPQGGILVVALLFVLYHTSFQSLLALLPLALALGYVVWRSDTLISGVLVHFANNVLAFAWIVTKTLRPDLELGIPSLPAAVVGALLALVGLCLFRRATVCPRLPASPQPTPWLRRAWPLLIVVPVFLGLDGLQFVAGRFPEALAFDRLTLQADGASNAPWEGPTRWEYDLRNALDKPVGRAECRLTREPEHRTFVLHCHVQQLVCEAQKGRGCLGMDEVDMERTVRWGRDDLQLMDGEAVQQIGEHRLTMGLAREGEGLVLSVRQDNGPVEVMRLPQDVLLMGEWPWRLSALPFSLSHSRKATPAGSGRWREEGQGSGPSAEDTYVVVRNAEPVWTPVGRFIAWRVTVGDRQTAWYDAEAPHTLVRYEDGSVTYLLADVEWDGAEDARDAQEPRGYSAGEDHRDVTIPGAGAWLADACTRRR